jgi:hypothetical protein
MTGRIGQLTDMMKRAGVSGATRSSFPNASTALLRKAELVDWRVDVGEKLRSRCGVLWMVWGFFLEERGLKVSKRENNRRYTKYRSS